jgi:hypothetical protein
MCMQCLGHFSPLPHPSLTPFPCCSLPYPSLPGRNYSALISNFVEERADTPSFLQIYHVILFLHNLSLEKEQWGLKKCSDSYAS